MLKQLDTNLWVSDSPLAFLGLNFGTRMTVVRLKSGDLWIHSPVALDDPLRSDLDQLGPVKQVVAPNLFHHLYAGDFTEAYPDAILHGVGGLAKKRKDLTFHKKLNSEADPAWEADLGQHAIAGIPKLRETVFFHYESRTLICCDLLMNIQNAQGGWTKLYLKLSGIDGKIGVSKIVKFVFQNRTAARQSFDRLLEWDIERIIIAHGDVIESNGKAILRDNYAWLK